MPRIMQRLLFNPRCWACGGALGRQRDFCLACRRDIFRRLAKDGFLFRHEGAATGLLACLRGSAPRTAANWCFALLEREGWISHWRGQGFSAIAIAPQNNRRQESGLEILARRLGAVLGLPVLKPFAKVGHHSQHGRTLTGRMDGPCFVRQVERVKGRVLLVDDVYTTGTTIDQCAYLLRQNGAEEVSSFSLARQVMPGFERKQCEASEESEEMDPLLLHLFV